MGPELNSESVRSPEDQKLQDQADLSAGLWQEARNLQESDLNRSDSKDSNAKVQDARTEQPDASKLPELKLSNSENSSKESSDKSKETEARPEKDLQEANTYLLKASEAAVNQSIWALPRWSRLPKPTPSLGCVSSFSNRFREAMQMAGVIDSTQDKQFRELYQVNMDEFNKVMGLDASDSNKRLLREIPASEVKEGDMVQGLNPGTTKRHMGVLGPEENGERIVFDNYAGKWRREGLEERFGIYEELRYYRVYLPEKQK